jgi:hypothetical protein
MTLLQKAENHTAYCKAAVYGSAGAGKSMTAALLAIGLAKHAGGAPVAFFDTETGSDFLIPLFREFGIELLVARSRTFDDLLKFMTEAEEAKAVAQIDSITHVWNDLRESYEKKLRRTKGLEIWDWAKIKPEWRRFTDAFLISKMHVVICGRAGNVYEQEWNEEKQKDEVVVTGTKMKAETEMSYEPSLLFEMERVPRRGAKGWTHQLTVLKDRFDAINGAVFQFERDAQGRFLIDSKPAETKNHVFEALWPHIERLNLGGLHEPLTNPSADSQNLFDSPESAIARRRAVDVTSEGIKEALILADIAGTGKDDKRKQTEALIAAFGTSSWSAITDLRLEDMQAGLAKLRANLKLDEPTTPQERELMESHTAAVLLFVGNQDAKSLLGESAVVETLDRARELVGLVFGPGDAAITVSDWLDSSPSERQARALVQKLEIAEKAKAEFLQPAML